jgi:hypothetical protein
MFTWWLQRKGLLTYLKLDVTIFHNLKFFYKVYCYKKVIKMPMQQDCLESDSWKPGRKEGIRWKSLQNGSEVRSVFVLWHRGGMDGWVDHLTTSMRVMYCRILEDCNVRVISKNEGAEAVVAYYEWFCSHSEIMNMLTLNGEKWMKTNYIKRFFHCFTHQLMHFSHTKYVWVFKLIKST